MRETVFTYRAHGLGIHSALPLSELIPERVCADVVVSLGKVDRSRLEVVGDKQRFCGTIDEACYAFDGAGAFLVRRGAEIIVEPDADADERIVRLCLLGPVLAIALHQKGRVVLHGSAVAINGSAVGFLGNNGWGKSTLAAACHNQGHEMIADDVLSIDMQGTRPYVVPSFPQFKLWPKSVIALGDMPENLPLVHPEFDKRMCRVSSGFATKSVPLKRLYVLARAQEIAFELYSRQEGLSALLRHWYGHRFGKLGQALLDQRSHFLRCTTVARQVTIRRLQRPSDLSLLPELVRLIAKDLENDS